MAKVDIFADGSCVGNLGPAGFAALLRCTRADGTTHERLVVGGFARSTNQRAEITAAIVGLEALNGHGHAVTIHSDSAYIVGAVTSWLASWQTNGWKNAKRKAIENRDLWERLVVALAPHTVTALKLEGHSGHAENEVVDAAAVEATRQPNLTEDVGYLAREAVTV